MDALGLVGPDFIVAHGVWLDDDDMRGLPAVAPRSPTTRAQCALGNGYADARRMLEQGVNVAIGTDGASCSDNQNMYEAMRTALYVSHARGPERHAEWLSTSEVLRAATLGSARALGFAKLGRIAKGYKADIVFLDLASINLVPLNDPVNQIVQTEDGRSVHSVMVDGRVVVANGALVGADMARLAADAEAARDRLDIANQAKKVLFEQLAPVVGSYCPGLGCEAYHIERHGPH